MTDKDIEKEIQSKGKTAPRVTPEYIESIIVSEHYFTAWQGDAKAVESDPFVAALRPSPDELKTLTFCVLILRNGFTVTGESACASPENFDAEIGRKIARQNAFNKIWMLEGYLLKQKLSDKDNLSEKIQSFMHDYDPAEFGDEESNGGLTYAKHFADALSKKLL